MANETRPRRESTGSSRIRKTPPSPPTTAPEDSDGTTPGSALSLSGPGDSASPQLENQRERKDREPYREEGPADREPIRYLRDRDREPARERPEREAGIPVRERLARDRSDREGVPSHHEGIPLTRDRETSPLARERSR